MMREKRTPGCLGWMREWELGTPGLVPDWLGRERDTRGDGSWLAG